MAKNVAYVAYFYHERPSKILSDLFGREFSPEEALTIDSYSLKVINEMNTPIDENSDSQKKYLSSKWQQEDIQAKHNMEKRRREYEKMMKKAAGIK